MQIRLEKRLNPASKFKIIIPIVSVLAALIFCALFLLLAGKNPINVYSGMFLDALTTQYGLSEIVVKMIPLSICAFGVAVAFRMQLWNIGAEGQFYMGAIGTGFIALNYPELPMAVMLPAMLCMAMLFGGIWGGIAGFLRNKWRVNEIISTLMLNYIAILSLNYLVYGPWKDPKGLNFPITAPFTSAAVLPTFGSTRIHFGIFIVLAIVVLFYFLFKNSKWGYRTRVIGLNPIAANYAGINIPEDILKIMFISGALSGLAGMAEISGVVGKLQQGISPGYGYTAIIIAWLARLNPLAVIVVSFLFSTIQVGAFMVQTMGISDTIATMIQGAILFFVIGAEVLVEYKLIVRFSDKDGKSNG